MATLSLVAAALACAAPGDGPDIPATVNAVSTAVQLTVEAQGGLPPSSTPPPTAPASAATAQSVLTQPPASTTPPPVGVTPAPTHTPGELARAGALVHASRWTTPPQIDGDLREWSLTHTIDRAVYLPENWSGAADLSATFSAAWDEVHLYLALRAADDVHVQTQRGELIFRGDSVELLLDADLAGDFADGRLGADDFQLGLSPGAAVGDAPEAYLWFPSSRRGSKVEVMLAARANGTDAGYTLEAAVPWALLNLTPTAGARFGFALSLSDNDSPDTAIQQTMISSAPARLLTDPRTWGTLILNP